VGCRVEQVVDLAGDQAFQAAGGFSPSVLFSFLFLDVGLGARVAAFPGGRDDVDGPVGLPVPAPVEPVPLGFAGGSRQRRHPAQHRERGFAVHPVGVVAYGDQDLAGGLGAIPAAAISCGARSVTMCSSRASKWLISASSCR
jgi:hypothetical protein